MLITCPSCKSEYNVPGAVPAGRTVKCAKCQFKWTPVPAPPPPPPQIKPEAPQTAPAIAHQPLAARAPRRPIGERPSWLLLAWIGSGVLLAALLAAAIVWRGPAMRAWPPSSRLYGWLHLSGPPALPVARQVAPHQAPQ